MSLLRRACAVNILGGRERENEIEGVGGREREREGGRERTRERGWEGWVSVFVSIHHEAVSTVSPSVELRSNFDCDPFCLIVYETVVQWLSNSGHIRSWRLSVTYPNCLE